MSALRTDEYPDPSHYANLSQSAQNKIVRQVNKALEQNPTLKASDLRFILATGQSQGKGQENPQKQEQPKQRRSQRPFVMMFTEEYDDEIYDNLTKREGKILNRYLRLLDCSDRNYINITQSKIAEQLGIDRSHVSRAVKKFFEIGLFIKEETNGSIYINPRYIIKGPLEEVQDLHQGGFTTMHFLFFMNAIVYTALNLSKLLF